MASRISSVIRSISRSVARKLEQFRKGLNKPQIIDREYIEDETGEEIGHIEDTDFPDKAERPLPHIPASHSPERKRKKAA